MDRYNSRKVLKTSDIDDGYWRKSLLLYMQLHEAVKNNNDKDLIDLIENPNLFIGRA